MIRLSPWALRTYLRRRAASEDDLFRRLLHNAGWLLSGTVIATVLGLGGTVLKARALGPELFGVLAVITAYVAVVERLATFQPWLALIKYGAEALERKRPDEFMGLVKISVALDLVGAVSGATLGILIALALAGRWGWDSQISRMAMVLSAGILCNLSGTPTGILRLLDRFRMFAVQKVLTASLGLAGAAVVYLAGGGIWGFLIVTLVSGIVGNLFLFAAGVAALRRRGLWRHRDASVAAWKPFLRFSGWTYATSTLDIPIRQLDVLIVSAVTSFEVTGLYKIIKQICALLAGLADPLYQAVYPQFAAMVATHRPPGRYVVRIGAVLAAVTGPIALVLAVSSPWWLGLVFGQAFAAGGWALSAFLLFTVLSISCLAVHPLFTALGYVKENALVLLVANTAYLVCAWLLTSAFGLIGLAVAFGIQLALVVGLKLAYMRARRIPVPSRVSPRVRDKPSHSVAADAAEVRA